MKITQYKTQLYQVTIFDQLKESIEQNMNDANKNWQNGHYIKAGALPLMQQQKVRTHKFTSPLSTRVRNRRCHKLAIFEHMNILLW